MLSKRFQNLTQAPTAGFFFLEIIKKMIKQRNALVFKIHVPESADYDDCLAAKTRINDYKF